MEKFRDRKLTPGQIKAIETMINRGDRVEVVPVKEGIKLLHVRREELKPSPF